MEMSSNSSGFIHKVFFMSNRSFAELCASRIRAAHPDVRLDIHSEFELFLSGIFSKVTDEDLILINHFFIDEVILALPALDRVRNLHIDFVIHKSIDGVAFDLMQCSGSPNLEPYNPVQPNQVISSKLYRGSRIRRNKSRFRQELKSKIQTLDILKSFIPKVRSYFRLGEFLDSGFKKLQGALRATGGVLIIEQKKDGRAIFHKIYGRGFQERAIAQRLRSPVCRKGIVFRDIPEANGIEIGDGEAGASSVQICASIESSSALGYFKINTDSPITAGDRKLVKMFREQVGPFIDNTITTQEMLERLNLKVSLIEPEAAALMLADKEKDISDFNLINEALTGWNGGDASGMQCRKIWMICDYFGTPACQGNGCFTENAASGHPDLFDNKNRIIINDDVKRIPKNDCVLNCDALSEADHVRGVVNGVTKQIDLQRKFSHLEQLARLGEFASEFAHEIRNPVTGISSSAQFLYETADIAEEYKPVIEEILLGSRMLEKTVKKYLNLTRPPDPRLEKCSINALLEQVCMSMRTRMACQKIAVECSLGKDLPEIYVDPSQVRLVFKNLVLNAIEALPDGGRLAIETFWRTGSADSMPFAPGSVVMSIADSGSGINPEDTERLFDPFYTTKHSGTGLGLYTSYNILRRHNAEIHLLSEAGKGTTVTVSFPGPGDS